MCGRTESMKTTSSTSRLSKYERDRSKVKVTTLGAARSAGKSCIIVEVYDRLFMFDCGIDPSFNATLRHSARTKYYPNFSKLGDIEKVECILISHCHVDHVGALAYFTETLGYDGAIFMTSATKHLSRVVLEESIKRNNFTLSQVKKSDSKPIDLRNINNCLKRIITYEYDQSFRNPITSAQDIIFRFLPAGHVHGSSMILLSGVIEGDEVTVLYTGDFNTTYDNISEPLSPLEDIKVDVLITETTFCNRIRDPALTSYSRLFEAILKSVSNNTNDIFAENSTKTKPGNVLIPVSSFGRLQDFMFVLNDFVEVNKLNLKIYFSSNLGSKYNEALSICPLIEDVPKLNFSELNHVSEWPFNFKDSPSKINTLETPFILLTPGAYLNKGLSRLLLPYFCERKQDLILFAGNCPLGSLGSDLVNATRKQSGYKEIEFERKLLRVYADVVVLDGLSNHTDAKGILDLISKVKPKQIVLVHGDEQNMQEFKHVIEKYHPDTSVYCPKLNETKSFS